MEIRKNKNREISEVPGVEVITDELTQIKDATIDAVSLVPSGGTGHIVSVTEHKTGVHSSDEVYSKVKVLLGIPENEPIFILRGQDMFAIKTIRDYRDRVRDGARTRPPTFQEWYDEVGVVISDFVVWYHSHKETAKAPD